MTANLQRHTEKWSYEKNGQLFHRLANGDLAAAEEMFRCNHSLVVSKVDALLAKLPHLEYLRGDLESAGRVGLYESIERLKRKGSSKTKPTRYMVRGINTHIQQAIEKEQTIHIPRETRRQAAAKGEPIEEFTQVSEGRTLAEFASLQAPNPSGSSQVGVCPSPHDAIDLRDEIAACCLDDMDRLIVRMREIGCTDEEIAKGIGVHQFDDPRIEQLRAIGCTANQVTTGLGVTPRSIRRRRQMIYKRLTERCPEYASAA